MLPPEALGHKFVIAGNQLIYQPVEQAKFFTDILLTFVPNTFESEWFEADIAKPRDERQTHCCPFTKPPTFA
jgi:hypothetical protein